MTDEDFRALRTQCINEFNKKWDERYPVDSTEYPHCQSDLFSALTSIMYLDSGSLLAGIIDNNFKNRQLTKEIADGIMYGLDASLSSLTELNIILPKDKINPYIKKYVKNYIEQDNIIVEYAYYSDD